QPLPSRLYAIVDASMAEAAGWRVPDLAHAYLDAGVRFMQLRAKTSSAMQMLSWVDEIGGRLPAYPGAVLVTNDRVDVAMAAGMPHVHLGQDDLSATDARALLGARGFIGWSTHTRDQ